MKVTGTSSEMKVEMDDGKVVVFEGELLVNGFWADKKTAKKWEPPNESIPFTETDLQKVINAVKEKNKTTKFQVEFD